MNNDVKLIFNEYGFGTNQIMLDTASKTILEMAFTTHSVNGEPYGVRTFVTFTYKMGNTYDIEIQSDDFLLVTTKNQDQVSRFKDRLARRSNMFPAKLIPCSGNRMSYQCIISNVSDGTGRNFFSFMANTVLLDLKELQKILNAAF